MPKLNQGLVGQFCSRMVSLHRRTKIAMMVTADLIALPFCFLVAMLLRGGDLKLASHFGPASYVLVAVVTIAAFSVSDLYRAVIRFIERDGTGAGRRHFVRVYRDVRD
jgi:Kef-type K+ transport system membrane component KefB